MSSSEVARTINALDIAVILAYLVGITVLGIWVGRRQKDSKDYFVADREIPWWAVMFSVVASETSALTFISVPGTAYLTDMGFLQLAFGYLLGRIVVARVLLPRYYEGEIVTAYTLLEKRFGLATRRFTSIVFMVTRALADAVRVFATAIPIALILGPIMPREYVMPVAVSVLGVLTIIYTYRGGMRAVVWTEIIQASIYIFGGLSALYMVGRLVPGGWGQILASGGAADKFDIVKFGLGTNRAPYAIWPGVVGGAFLSMASHGADQLIVQRLLSSKSLRDAQIAIIGSGVAVIVQFALFLLLGVGLWAFYQARAFPTPDAVFPSFIIGHMPHGLVGLLLAAVVAATMSTHSGAINSLAAASTHDIYLPLSGRRADDPMTLRVGKMFALGWGVVLTAGALLFPDDNKTPVVQVALSIASFTQGALLGAFFLGNFWRRANQRDAIVGMSVAIIVMAGIVFANPLVAANPSLEGLLGWARGIAFPWYVLIGTSITMGVAMLFSLTHAPPPVQTLDVPAPARDRA